MGRGIIDIYRCISCGTLLAWPKLKLSGKCHVCGGSYIRGASPKNIFEKIKCLWWALTLEGEEEHVSS